MYFIIQSIKYKELQKNKQNIYLAEEKNVNWFEKTNEYKNTTPQTKTDPIKK